MGIKLMSDYNKINTKEELTILLNSYKGILSDSMIDYLNSLIELDFSVIRDYISDNDRVALSELEIYKRIAIYNIYTRALNIFKENESTLKISSDNQELEVYASLGKRNSKLFDFNYNEDVFNFSSEIPSDYKTMKIGNISLFQTLENADEREKELMRVISELESLYDEKNPYYALSYAYGGPSSQWAFEHTQKIKAFEERFNELDSKKELTDDEKQEIEITNRYHELLLEDYGLTNNDFKDESNQYSFEDNTNLSKTLVKRMPNINIENNIKYI